MLLLVLVCATSAAAWNVLGNELACKLSGAVSEIASGLSLTTNLAASRCEAPLLEQTDGPAAFADYDALGSMGGSGAGQAPSPSSATAPGGGASEAGGRAPPVAARTPGDSAARFVEGVLKVMCPRDKGFLADLKQRGVSITAYDRIYFDDPYYDGTKWTTKRFEAGGTTAGTDITLIRSGSAQHDAATIYHEGVHTAQPASMPWRELEYDAYVKEDQWRIAHGMAPHQPSFRKKDAAGNETTNEAAIRAFVDKEYPGVTAKAPGGGAAEQVVGKTSAGKTLVRRADGSTYERAPKRGDSYAAKSPVTVPTGGIPIDMAKLQCP